MKDVCEEIFVQSRDVREFFNRSIPVIASLQHDGVFLPPAESWSSHPLCPPESKIDLIEGSSPRNIFNIRPLSARTCPFNLCNPPRDLSLPRNIQFQHGL